MAIYVERERKDFWQLAKEPDETYIDPLGPKDCGTHSASRMAMRALEGIRPAVAASWPPTGYQIRRFCYNPDGTRDTTGGVHHGQTKTAVKILYGVELTNSYAVDFDAVPDALDETRGVSLSIWYKPIRDTASRRGSFTFYQNHEIFLSSYDRLRRVFKGVVDSLADGRQTGLYHGPGEYPLTLIREAAGELNVSQTGGYKAVGAGKAYMQTTKATGAAPTATRFRVEISGKTPTYDQPNGNRVSAVYVGHYICSRVVVGTVRWYRILTLADGSPARHRGEYFKPNAHVEVKAL